MGLDLLGLTKTMTLKHVLGVVYMAFLVAIFRENRQQWLVYMLLETRIQRPQESVELGIQAKPLSSSPPPRPHPHLF